MRRLHLDQTVSLSLDEERQPIPCKVLDVQGAASRLTYLGELSPRTVASLVSNPSGYLVFNEFGVPIGLRVAVRPNPPFVDVAVMDGITMPERRKDERVRLETRTRIVRPGADDAQSAWTKTLNLSAHGALLSHHAALEGQQELGLELMFGEDPRPVIAQAKVARRLKHAVGVTFESIPDDGATRLQEYLAGSRHRRALRG